MRSGTPKRRSRGTSGGGFSHEDVVLLEAVLVGDLDRIAEALGGDQRRPGALALDDGVGGERRAVHDQSGTWPGAIAGELQCPPHAVEHTVLRRAGLVVEHLREKRIGRLQHDVGEGAADIDGEADGFRRSDRRHDVLLQRNATAASSAAAAIGRGGQREQKRQPDDQVRGELAP